MTGNNAQTRDQAAWQFRARRIVMPPLLLLIAGAWLLLILSLTGQFGLALFPPPDMAEPAYALGTLGARAAGWTVTVIAVVLPTALPAVDGYIAFLGKSNRPPPAILRSFAFVAGTLCVWLLFAAVVALVHTALYRNGALEAPQARLDGLAAAGGLLLAAGIYQWTPVKTACLRKCRAPISFFMTTWLDGKKGAYLMGLIHGLYCVGCTAPLLALLFIGGTAVLLSIIPVALYIAAEKILPGGEALARVAGALAVAYGGWLLFFQDSGV